MCENNQPKWKDETDEECLASYESGYNPFVADVRRYNSAIFNISCCSEDLKVELKEHKGKWYKTIYKWLKRLKRVK